MPKYTKYQMMRKCWKSHRHPIPNSTARVPNTLSEIVNSSNIFSPALCQIFIYTIDKYAAICLLYILLFVKRTRFRVTFPTITQIDNSPLCKWDIFFARLECEWGWALIFVILCWTQILECCKWLAAWVLF